MDSSNNIPPSGKDTSRINFDEVKQEAERRAQELLWALYPEGNITGDEFEVASIHGGKGKSFKYNWRKHTWSDFAEDQLSGHGVWTILMQRDGLPYAKAMGVIHGMLNGSNTTQPQAGNTNQAAELSKPETEPERVWVNPAPASASLPFKIGDSGFGGKTLSRIHHYRHADGGLQLVVLRYEDQSSKVTPVAAYYDGMGWKIERPKNTLLPLYNLDQLAMHPEKAVLLVEGEKTADAAQELFPEHVVTTWIGGTGNIDRADWSPLAKRRVVYWPDADDAGRKTVSAIAKHSFRANAARFALVRLPKTLLDKCPSWDLADPWPEELASLTPEQLVAESTTFKREPHTVDDILGQQLNPSDWAYLWYTQLLVHIPTKEQFTHAQFNTIASQVAGRMQSTGRAQPSRKLINGDFTGFKPIKQVKCVGYDPANPDDTFYMSEQDGLERLNLAEPNNLLPRKGDTRILDEHIRYLTGSAMEAEHTLNWLAFAVQNPDRKINHALVLIGPQGTGKSFIGHLMRYMYGVNAVETITTHDLKSGWTDWLEAKSLLLVEEIMALGRVEIMNTLKPLITEPRVRIERKHISSYEIENFANFIFFSNHDDALHIDDEGDRRFFVTKSLHGPRDSGYYKALFGWLDQNPDVAYHCLLNRPVGAFNPYAPPPMTEAKRAMVENSRSPEARLIEELIAEEKAPFHHDIVSARTLQKAAQHGQILAGFNAKSQQVALKSLGIPKGIRTSVQGPEGSRKETLYIIRDFDRYKDLPKNELGRKWREMTLGEDYKPEQQTLGDTVFG